VIKFFCRCGLDVELADDDAPRYQLIHVYPFGSDTETYAVTTQCPRTLPSVSFRSVPGIPRVVTGKIVHPAAPPPTPPVPPASDATATSSASAASAASTSTTTADKWWSLRACDPDDVRRIGTPSVVCCVHSLRSHVCVFQRAPTTSSWTSTRTRPRC
jgi:hypothetical protein